MAPPHGAAAVALASCWRLAAGQPVTPGATPTQAPASFIPGPGFPGETAEASNAAFASGHQPASLELWPREDAPEGALALGGTTAIGDLSHCWSTTVLLDLTTGWRGHCLELDHKPDVATMQDCHDTAFQDPTLPVWQYNHHSGCWQGIGRNCDTESLPQTIVGSQRLQHGAVRVLKDMTGWHVHNLLQLGIFQHGGEVEDIRRCRSWCYSNIFCEFWQYGQGGCWVDNSDGQHSQVRHPLVVGQEGTAGVDNSSNWARTSVAGEYLQHYCPPHTSAAPGAATQPLTPSVSATLSPWLIALVGLAALGVLSVLIYACTLCGGTKTKQSTRSRGVKPTTGGRERDVEPPREPERQLEEMEPMMQGLPQAPLLWNPPVLALPGSQPQASVPALATSGSYNQLPMLGGSVHGYQPATPSYSQPQHFSPAMQQFAVPPQGMMPPQYRGGVP